MQGWGRARCVNCWRSLRRRRDALLRQFAAAAAASLPLL